VTARADDIRSLIPPGGVVLGPMAGVTEAPFRGICKRMGATLTYSEMVSAKGLHHNPDSRVSRALLTFSPEETPCAVQLYGSDGAIMAAQAVRILERYGADVALIDINMGCPVAKVVSKGEGSALMRTPDVAAGIVERVVAAVDVPVTVKFRAGWEAGASAMAVHGRTRAQFYRGRADWEVIARVKAAVSVPVFGSGDVLCAQDAKAMLEQTGVDAVMVARGAQGYPWIFREARALIDRGEVLARPGDDERIAMAREHARALVAFGGERAFVRMRKHVGWYIAGMPGATFMRERANKVTSHAELDALLVEYSEFVEARRRRGGAP
jgi:tRNA-dihydrouridine synthase B